MKFKSKNNLILTLFATSIILFSCKAKKPVVSEPDIVVETPVKKEAPKKEVLDSDGDGIPDDQDKCPDQAGTTANGCPVLEAKDFDFKNIQFEFNSSVLKTSSYTSLEKISQQIKNSEGVKFELNGHSSAEGTQEKNMMLSVDRANAVKSYLVNNGISSKLLITKGFGESVPITGNDTDEGRVLNRRVEIQPIK